MPVPSTFTPEQRVERARNAGRAANSPEVLAARLVRDWPTLTPERRETLRAVLRPITRPTK